MNLNEPPIPGISLAGIRINENIEEAASRVPGSYCIRRHHNFVSIEDGLLEIGHDGDGSICYAVCDARAKISYKNKLWAGMTVKDVLERTRTQVAFAGCVVVDNIQGIGLPLPSVADDFERITDFLALDYVFERMSVFRI